MYEEVHIVRLANDYDVPNDVIGTFEEYDRALQAAENHAPDDMSVREDIQDGPVTLWEAIDGTIPHQIRMDIVSVPIDTSATADDSDGGSR